MPKKNRRTLLCESFLKQRYSSETLGNESEDSTSEEGEEMETELNNINIEDKEKIDFDKPIFLNDIGDIFQLCKASCPLKYLSVLVYTTLRHVGLNWQQCDDILRPMGSLLSETSQKHTEAFLFGDFKDFTSEHRGGKHTSAFFDDFPEIETEAKVYTLTRCSDKAANFSINDLARFIDEKYYETTGTTKPKDSELIRSEASVRLDLRRWGATFRENGARPYWEGHERADVVKSRETFINYFLDNKQSYYTVNDNENLPGWIKPEKKPGRILIFHDESTFRSGEIASRRWFYGDQAPFYSKGRGRSNMVSDFVVQHHSGPYFNLSEKEMKRAVKKYPQLAASTDLDYVPRTATASLHIGYDCYMDNEAVLDQDSNGKAQVLDCFFVNGPNRGLSKGLAVLGKELNVRNADRLTLPELRSHLADHPAFQTVGFV
ncbi:unnamed protein product [Rotaria sp. Silwood1]|nr:unnamed protein product [Rotaria sp. Silwood1]